MTMVLGSATIEELRQAVRGTVVVPGDVGYDATRALWNGMIDARPAAIVRCRDVADVIAALRFGRSEGLEIAVRGGGHSVAGLSTTEGGLVIDLRDMGSARVDPVARTVVAEPGLTWHDLDEATQAFGLAVTGGLISSTGIAGFTLGGGIGWLMRRDGLACDNLLAADVVTADGQAVRASATENDDLLWALRGGGGNFGIVTSFTFRLQPVGPIVLAGPIFYPGDEAARVVGRWRDYAIDAPDAMTTFVSLATAPPLPFLPPEVHGTRVAIVVSVWAGALEDGAEAAEPLRRLGTPIADHLGPMPYTTIQSLVDASAAAGARAYFKSSYLSGLPDAALETLVRFHGPAAMPAAEIHLHQMGGAVARVPDDATAFGNRQAPFTMNVIARWEDPVADGAAIGWAQGLHRAMAPFETGGTYVNFLSRGDDRVRAAYAPATYARLARVKARWDPTNVFHRTQNIQPFDDRSS